MQSDESHKRFLNFQERERKMEKMHLLLKKHRPHQKKTTSKVWYYDKDFLDADRKYH